MEARVAARDLYEDFVRTFGNVLFAVCLFVVWGIFTLIGVIVEQGLDASAYFQNYAAPVARAIVRLGFDNIYHSYWYVGIIGLILLSLTVCTFKRVIPARLPPLRPVKIDKIPLNMKVHVAGTVADVRAKVDAFFRSRGWQVRKRTFDGTEWIFADKFNWARRGVLIAHLGFVIIAAGATIYWARGFAGESAIVTGQTLEVPRTHALIRLDSFAYKIQPISTKSGMVYQPIDYVSHVTVTGNDGKVKAETIRVNQPIDIDGTLYYQASYGFAMRFDVLHNGVRVANLSDRTLMEGEALDIPGTPKSVQYARFVPTVDRVTGQPGPDPRVNDPAVVLNVFNQGSAIGAALVPLQTWIDLGGGWKVVPHRYLLYTGLQYRYDPGAVIVGIGAFVLLAGLVIAFYFLPARLYINVDEADDGTTTVGIAATTVKGYDIYEKQFSDLKTTLEGAL
ncbi:MAG: cytochrome c biogenesis protein ResB [Candidatus Eremiobacteraeota bacterium]|nr:cytochrome c biogenesis protein ResB [Candidatus Eremiobacteraeota bacterium]